MPKHSNHDEIGDQGQINPDQRVRKGWRAWLAGSPVLFLSVLIHLIFLALALYFVVQRIQEKRKQTFSEVAIKTSPVVQMERKVQMTQMQAAQSAPEMNQRIVTSNLSPINLPPVPLPTENTGEGAAKMGSTTIGGSGLQGTGNASGGMPIDVSEVLASTFGISDGDGQLMKGEFYDLKQSSSNVATNVTPESYPKIIAEFISSGWSSTYFNKYFKGPKPLYLQQLFMPYMHASDGPKAFSLEAIVKPKLWVVLYQGAFKVNHSGMYRFVGFGDDVLEVAIDKRLVLEGSWRDFDGKSGPIAKAINHPATGTYKYHFTTAKIAPHDFFEYLQCGDWMQLDEGTVYSTKILIGEHPGGRCAFFLMVQEKDHEYAKTPEGSPILPVFNLTNHPTGPGKDGVPAHLDDLLGWMADSGEDPSQSNNP